MGQDKTPNHHNTHYGLHKLRQHIKNPMSVVPNLWQQHIHGKTTKCITSLEDWALRIPMTPNGMRPMEEKFRSHQEMGVPRI